MSNWSNRPALKPPSRERADELVAESRERMTEQLLQPYESRTIISAEMFERGKREGWIVQRDGEWFVVHSP